MSDDWKCLNCGSSVVPHQCSVTIMPCGHEDVLRAADALAKAVAGILADEAWAFDWEYLNAKYVAYYSALRAGKGGE